MENAASDTPADEYLDLSSSSMQSQNNVISIGPRSICSKFRAAETVDSCMNVTSPIKTPPRLNTENSVAPTLCNSVQYYSSEYEDGRNPDDVDSNRLVVPTRSIDSIEHIHSEFPRAEDDSPNLGVEHLNISDDQSQSNRNDVEDEETDEERRVREEEESEALARQLLAEEAMASYQQSADFLRDHANEYNVEDLATLQAIMAEEAVAEEDQYENEGGDGILDSGELSYDHLIQLGEEIGDVKTEMWMIRAREEIDKLPIVILDEDIMSEKNDAGDCGVKCIICQFSYQSGERTRLLPCGHFFHSECVDQWLLHKDFCPYCRQSIVKN